MDSIVRDENGNEYYIKAKLSSGGQGVVYTIRDNDSIVIKALPISEGNDGILQNDQVYENYRKKVRRIVSIGEYENLAIPIAMLEKPFCGYVMQFMNGLQPIANLMFAPPYLYKKNEYSGSDESFIYINDCKLEDRVIAKTREEIIFAYNYDGGIGKRIRCLAKLAKILGCFEDDNVVYCDLSPNNVFISKGPENYETWLIDLDNLSFGSKVNKPIGTPKFMAPEVVNGGKNSIYSDRYSFALLAYRFLMLKDPFEGDAINEYESWEDDYSDEDQFEQAVANGNIAWIWEKDDDSNRSKSGFNPFLMLPLPLIDLFERTLNRNGRTTPQARPSMWEWYDELILASESISVREVKFQETAFTNLRKKQGNTKYYKQDIEYLTNQEVFSDNEDNKIRRYKVVIKGIRPLMDEKGIVANIAEGEKIVYWDINSKTTKYSLSNFDLLDRIPKRYVKDFLVLKRQEVLFVKSNVYEATISDRDYKVVIIVDGKVTNQIDDILKNEIIVLYKGEVIRKITITME